MTYIRRLILALALSAGLAPAFAQVPPPVPALPDTERRTSYSISASTCACNVNFALYGDSTDYANWIEVFVNGVRMAQAGNWTLSSVTGTIGSIPLPITNAVLTFTAPQTGTIQIVGARRPRRTSQFNEGAGVPTRNFNVVLSDLTAQNRELWDKTNDVTGRALMSQPGNTVGLLPLPSTCINGFLGFDPTGLTPVCRSASGTGNVTLPVVSGNLACFSGTTGILSDCGSSPTTLTLPIGNITGLGTNVATFLATPTSANLAAALTNETGTGVAVFSDSPVFTTQIQSPLVIGGTAAGSSATVKSTSNGSPSGDSTSILGTTVSIGGPVSAAHTVNLASAGGGITVNLGSASDGLTTFKVFTGAGVGQTWVSGGANTTLTFPAATDTLVGKATTDVLTNKTFSAGGTGNVLTLRAATIQKFTTGTGATYTTPATSSFAVVKFCGPGGGGSGSGTGTTGGTGGTGTSSVFNSITCTGGAGSTASVPGVGGTCSGGSPTETWAGSPGGGVQTGIAGTFLNGGIGGSSVLFGGGSQVAGVAATGGGGGGGFFNGAGNTGGGGGGGGCATQIVAGAGATYTYTVGTAGGAGTAGTSGSVGFAGSTGYLEGVEY